MRTSSFAATLLLASAFVFTSCQSGDDGPPVAADLNSANPHIAEQARKVQELISQLERQKATIETEKNKLTAMQQQLEGARQNLDGIKKEVQANP